MLAYSLFFKTDATILCLLLFIACIAMVKVGQVVRNKFLHPDEPESKGGVNSLLGALFGLWGFMLAFNFGNSASRFESVRNVMIEETNAMRAATQRTRTFPDSIGNDLRADLKLYLQARIDYYNTVTDPVAFEKAKLQSTNMADQLWNKLIHISSISGLNYQTNNMFSSVTTMIDISTKRDAMLSAGVPEPIQYMLFFLAIAISFIGGFTTPVIKHKEWIVIIGFVLLACSIIYITLDLSRPMRGFIKPESGEQRIEELHKLLK